MSLILVGWLLLLDPDDQVVDVAPQEALDGVEQGVGVGPAGRDADHVLGDGEAAARLGSSEAVVGDQLRQLGPLLFKAVCLRDAGRGALALVPAQRPALGNEKRAAREGPVAEFDVLGAPLGERLVVASDLPVEVA